LEQKKQDLITVAGRVPALREKTLFFPYCSSASPGAEKMRRTIIFNVFVKKKKN